MTLAGFASYTYTVLLKPKPVRWVTNKLLLLILPKSVHLKEGVLLLHQNDPVISGALALGVYEPYQMDLFRLYVKAGDVVADVGANIGLYTLIAAKRVGENGKVFSFEPERENFSILSENISLNGLHNVTAFARAVSDRNGDARFFISEDNKGNHSLIAGAGLEDRQTVRTVKFDDALREQHVEKIDVLKIDIQGAEPLAFSGMDETLKKCRVIFTEYEPAILRSSGHNPIEMLQLLQSYGYALFCIDENTRTTVRIEDLEKFTENLRGDMYANILGLGAHHAQSIC